MSDQNVFVPTTEDVNTELEAILDVTLNYVKEVNEEFEKLYLEVVKAHAKVSVIEEFIGKAVKKYKD